MITIPNKNLKQKYYDNLSILWEAIFLELNDERLVSFISPEDFEKRVELLRGSDLAEKLYDMLQMFGEEDFYEMIKPVIIDLQDSNPLGENYLESFTKCFDKL